MIEPIRIQRLFISIMLISISRLKSCKNLGIIYPPVYKKTPVQIALSHKHSIGIFKAQKIILRSIMRLTKFYPMLNIVSTPYS